jgi:hypothetical protein
MKILRSFMTALQRASSEPKMVLVLYLLNVLFAIPLAMAWRSVLDLGLGRSMDSSHLMQGLDFQVLQDFMNLHRDGLSVILAQMSWAVFAFMLVNTFLAGGILSALQAPGVKFSASNFFGGCARYFGRFLRLFIVFVILLVIVGLLMMVICAFVVQALGQNAASEITYLWVMIAAVVLFLLPMMLIVMIADYAKVSVVLSDERSMLKSAGRSAQFVFRHLFGTCGLGLLMLLIPIALVAVYLVLDLSIGMATNVTIVLMFIIQQIFMISRSWTKVFFFSGELEFYQMLQPVVNSNAAAGTQAEASEPIRI